MDWKTRIEDVETALNLLTSLNISKEEAQSFIIKLWYLVHHREEFLIIDDRKEISIRSILVSSLESWVDVVSDFEIYKVSNIKLRADLFAKLVSFIRTISIEIFLFAIKDDKTVKMEGHFYSPNWIVDEINDEFKDTLDNHSVIDLTAGMGYFLTPLLQIPRTKTYAIELDPHVFEAMIFGFLLTSGLDEHQKAKLILTVKNGDSLLGFKEELLDSVLRKPDERMILLEYRNARSSLLNREKVFSVNLLTRCLKLRNDLSKFNNEYKEFNWFLDFPELFIDQDGEKLEEYGVDCVVGNPPWVHYSKINFQRYEKILKKPEFADLLQGKYNFFLPFAILAHRLSKMKGGLVLPQTLFTESYAQKFRKYIFNSQTPYMIKLFGTKGFRNVVNEFCTLVWNKVEKTENIEFMDLRNKHSSQIRNNHILPPFYRLPLLPFELLNEISTHFRDWATLDQFISTRRGFTLTKKYQKEYSDFDLTAEHPDKKRIVKNSIFNEDTKKGIFNFQVYYSSDEFIYDKEFLGAPGDEFLFEQPKIIRRNRGRKWFIGLDVDLKLYVNDIFDIICMNDDRMSLKALFGYLCSSYIQLITEGYLQKDITSNSVRYLPIPEFSKVEILKMETAVDKWLISDKSLDHFRVLRKEIDDLLSIICEFSEGLIDHLSTKVEVNWKEV